MAPSGPLTVLRSSTVGNPAVTHLDAIVLRLNSTPSELPSIGSANDEESQLAKHRRCSRSRKSTAGGIVHHGFREASPLSVPDLCKDVLLNKRDALLSTPAS